MLADFQTGTGEEDIERK